MAIFKSTKEVVQEMLDDYKTLTGLELKITDLRREEVIKMFTYAGAISQLYARCRRNYDDFFPASSSEEALEKHLAARQLDARIAAQPSTGTIRLTGVNGTVFGTGKQVRRVLDGKIFVSTSSGTVSGGQVDITFQSLLSGNDQNIDSTGQEFTLITPVTGIDAICENQTQFLSGRDKETAGEMLERIEAHDLGEETGGNLAAYETFAKDADSRVVTAKALKTGPDAVSLVITSGTTDIEAAVEAGDPVLRLPAGDLVDDVQAYVELQNPVTDTVTVVAPTELSKDVTVTYSLLDETLRTEVDAEIDKVVKIFLYSARAGDTIHPTELERAIDERVGHLIDERRVSNFNGGTPEYTIANDKILAPGTITKASF